MNFIMSALLYLIFLKIDPCPKKKALYLIKFSARIKRGFLKFQWDKNNFSFISIKIWLIHGQKICPKMKNISNRKPSCNISYLQISRSFNKMQTKAKMLHLTILGLMRRKNPIFITSWELVSPKTSQTRNQPTWSNSHTKKPDFSAKFV